MQQMLEGTQKRTRTAPQALHPAQPQLSNLRQTFTLAMQSWRPCIWQVTTLRCL